MLESVVHQSTSVTATMRAAVVNRYGPPEVVRLAEVVRPRPGTGEVLVLVRAAAVTSADSRIRRASFPSGFGPLVRLVFGITRPRRPILGSTFAGVIDTLGAGVTDFEPGQAVCGMTGTKLGAHAEYLVVPGRRVTQVPVGVSHEDAAGVLFGGTAAQFFLRDKGSVAPGRSVLVNGASGAVGTSAVQLAAHYGAKVTAVTSAANAALVASLGADDVINYTDGGLVRNDMRFDVVLDCVGNLTIESGRRLLTDGGVLVLAVASLWSTIRAHGDVVAGSAPERVEDFKVLLELVAGGELTVVHDSTYDLEDIVEAHRRVDTRHKRGNVVVRPNPEGVQR